MGQDAFNDLIFVVVVLVCLCLFEMGSHYIFSLVGLALAL